MEQSGIQITSNKNVIVEISGKNYGKTPIYVDDLKPGIVEVKITEERTGQTWEEKTRLVKGSLTTIYRDFGDREYKSSGYTLFLEKDISGNTSASISGTPQMASVSIDGKALGTSPIDSSIESGNHIFKITSPGYEDKEIEAEIQNGYKIFLSFNLASSPDNLANEKETLLTIGANEVVIAQTYIDINPGFDTVDPKEVYLDQEKYPLLFNIDNEFARINAKEFSGGGIPETKLIYLSGQIPNHGSLVDNYYVIVDPEIGKVVQEGHYNLFGNVHINNSCTSCALPGLFFQEYSKKDRAFVLTNNKHKNEFTKILKEYEQFEQKAICRIDKKDYLLSEALNIAKDNDRCSDQTLGDSYPDSVDNTFLTIGQYKQTVKNIKSIISGENIKMLPEGFYGEGLSPITR